jgi:hypothetical protein
MLVADIEGFNRLERDNPIRILLRRALYGILGDALEAAKVSPAQRELHDRGDAVLVLVAPQVSKTVLFDPLVVQLRAGLRRHNRISARAARMRLRVALHAGEVVHDEQGLVGEDLNALFRLLDADPLRDALAASGAELALLASEVMYAVVRQWPDCAIDPAWFQKVRVLVKETDTTAWLYVPRLEAAGAAASPAAAAAAGREQRAGEPPREGRQADPVPPGTQNIGVQQTGPVRGGTVHGTGQVVQGR